MFILVTLVLYEFADYRVNYCKCNDINGVCIPFKIEIGKHYFCLCSIPTLGAILFDIFCPLILNFHLKYLLLSTKKRLISVEEG